MTARRSDAMTALISEIVACESELVEARGVEEEASRESIAARQVLDAAIVKRKASEDRLGTTREALQLIRVRDDIGQDTVEALLARARR